MHRQMCNPSQLKWTEQLIARKRKVKKFHRREVIVNVLAKLYHGQRWSSNRVDEGLCTQTAQTVGGPRLVGSHPLNTKGVINGGFSKKRKVKASQKVFPYRDLAVYTNLERITKERFKPRANLTGHGGLHSPLRQDTKLVRYKTKQA
ncbi:hypothetical protein DAPPUDRAFT_238209 [Daphnia pulex]|uniref:Uncharacterized protein n=1 Tax=Daphnia pulex TaxID=6669 RepID=E9G5S9_DAPPU|nr:hypothetical protein DAPPUDRAFT_238209 [Daphnia pulex]|eukprot:EFX85117.1 hypothetical protein DAPPUDRAFT_238209 [Daphnia pulex]